MSKESLFAIQRYEYTFKGASRPFSLHIHDFRIRTGEIVFLHGPSGCGKTTLLKLLSGAIPSILEASCRKIFPKIGFIMHESTLLPWLSIMNNLSVEERLRRQAADVDRFCGLCERMELGSECLQKKAAELSLGMRQRIEIAKALCFSCDLLLLDEGLSGIDVKIRGVVARMLWDSVVGEGISIVGTAHHMSDLLMLAQRIYLVENGNVSGSVGIDIGVSERLQMTTQELMGVALRLGI